MFHMTKYITKYMPSWSSRYKIGVEISDQYVKVVELATTKGMYAIKQHLKEPLERGVMDDGRVEDPIRLQQALQLAATKLDLSNRSVHLAVPSQTAMVRYLKLPDINERDLRKLVDFEVTHNIHLPFDRPFYDFAVMRDETNLTRPSRKAEQSAQQEADPLAALVTAKPPKETEPEALGAEETENLIDVMLVAVSGDVIEQYIELFKAANLKLRSIEIKSLSLFRGLQYAGINQGPSTIIVADVHPTASDLSIFHNGQLKITRSVPISFGDGDESLQEEDPLSSIIAETRLFADNAWSNGCNDLAHEIDRLINFYRYTLNNREQAFDSVILSGEVHQLERLRGMLAERLGLPCELHPARRFPLLNDSRELSDEHKCSLAVPIGLALRGRN